MSKMKLQETEGLSSYNARLEYWTSKELQLNMLHEEIIHKREALLRISGNILYGKAREEPLLSNMDATLRNDKLVKDVRSLEEYLTEQHQEPVNSTFAVLQANYKSMVENMFPIWQKSLKEVQTRADSTTE